MTKVLRCCPQCGCQGDLVQATPLRIRRCKNGHRWADGGRVRVIGYVTLAERLETSQKAIKALVEALRDADVMLWDLTNYLTPAQRDKEGVMGLQYRLRKLIKEHG